MPLPNSNLNRQMVIDKSPSRLVALSANVDAYKENRLGTYATKQPRSEHNILAGCSKISHHFLKK